MYYHSKVWGMVHINIFINMCVCVYTLLKKNNKGTLESHIVLNKIIKLETSTYTHCVILTGVQSSELKCID